MAITTARTAGGGGGGKLTPNLDKQSTKAFNLTVLQRTDPYIEEILITAAHVTMYEFDIDLNRWSRKDVEGPFFVVKRNCQPRFKFIVMNRRHKENLVEDLLGDFEYEVQQPYVLYRNAAQEVNGIWFYNPQECDEVANLFSRILGAYVKSSPKPQITSSKSEFEERKVVPTCALIEGQLEPAYPSSSTRDLPEDSSFTNFFNSAMNIGYNASSTGISGQLHHSSASAVPTFSHHSAPSFSRHDASELILSTHADLVKPSHFFIPTSSPRVLAPPISSTFSTAPPHPHPDMQMSYGPPFLQPFRPPTPPPSLTPNPTPSYIPLTREKVREAMITLVQENHFIDTIYQALHKVQQS